MYRSFRKPDHASSGIDEQEAHLIGTNALLQGARHHLQ